jgi:uroporphyrinogen-III decarboxylase
VDLERFKDVLNGEACLFGNAINTLTTNPGEIEEKVKQMILKIGHGGGFVLGSGSPITNSVQPENVDAMIAAARKYGRSYSA